MIVATAFVPATPLLVPEVAQGAAPELDDVRFACEESLRRVIAAGPQEIVVVASGTTTREHPYDANGSLAPFGVDVRAGGRGRDSLPPELVVGAWLLDTIGWVGPRWYCEVSHDADSKEWGGVARRILERQQTTGLLVVGDGSACRAEKAPREFDPRAEEFDKAMAAAIDEGDPLLGPIDTADGDDLAKQLHVGGRPAWHVAASAHWWNGAAIEQARLDAHEAPYGVGYLVGSWVMAAP